MAHGIFSCSAGALALEKGMATHSSILSPYSSVLSFRPGEIHGQRSLVGSQSISHNRETNTLIGNSYLWHVGSHFLTGVEPRPLYGEHGVLATGPPGKSLIAPSCPLCGHALHKLQVLQKS